MKKIVFLILITLASTFVFSQNFEGKISYQNTYKSKLTNMTDQQFTDMLGSTQEYFIKNGDYKSVLNGKLMQWQIYNNAENKLYTKMSNSEKAIWNDASVQGDEILKMEVNKNTIEILGSICDVIILTCKSGIQKYYFSSKIAVDAKLFVNHKFGNWFDFISKSNALPLKIVVENAQFIMTSIANEVKSMQLNKNIFELPIGLITEKSPY